MIYAQLDNENICVGVSELTTKIENAAMIEIPKLSEDYLYRKYENKKWSKEKYLPPEPEIVDETAEDLKFKLDIEYRLSMIELKKLTT